MLYSLDGHDTILSDVRSDISAGISLPASSELIGNMPDINPFLLHNVRYVPVERHVFFVKVSSLCIYSFQNCTPKRLETCCIGCQADFVSLPAATELIDSIPILSHSCKVSDTCVIRVVI